MKYGSVCSGVEAATVAWHSLGWEPQWFSEIEHFPSAVLKHHYPDVPNYGDMTKFKEWPDDRTIDLLVGGTPCQSFSVAGLRKGLDDPRGNLMLTYLAIAAQYRAQWLVWENVPGVLSSNNGRDFGTFLGALGKLGYGFAYRVLDAQYFGVAQRRRRVFVVGYLGDWRRAAAVLFERESLSGHPTPRRETREEVVGTVTTRAGSGSGGGLGTDEACNEYVQPVTTGSLCARTGRSISTQDAAQGHLLPIAFPAEMSGTQAASTPDISPTLSVGHTTAITYDMRQHHNPQPTDTFGLTASNCKYVRGDTPLVAHSASVAFDAYNQSISEVPTALRASNGGICDNTVMQSQKVRRLTPIETERLQGFPDNYTKIPYRKKDAEDCPDGPRYKAMGNSMAVPVMNWIGKRIESVIEKGKTL